jgi:hypothetical protein
MAEQRRININGRPLGPQQAPVGRTGQQLDRNAPRKAYRLPEARKAAAAAMEVMEAEFRGAEWLVQVRDGIELFVQRCIEQFAATPTPSNASAIRDGSDYKAFARTAQEIKETMAAEEGAVTKARNVPRYKQRPDEVDIPEQEIADPMKSGGIYTPAPTTPPPAKGWAL